MASNLPAEPSAQGSHSRNFWAAFFTSRCVIHECKGRRKARGPLSLLLACGDCCFSTRANLEREFANRGVHGIGDSRSLGDRTAGVSSKDANEVWKRNVTSLNIRLVLQSKHVRTGNSLLACNSLFPLACVRSWVQSPALKEKKMGGWAKKN